MTAAVPGSRRRAVAVSAVCLGHVLVLLAVWELRQAPARSVDDRARPVPIRWLPERRERAPQARAVAQPRPAPALPARHPAIAVDAPVEPVGVSSTLRAVPADAGETGAATVAAGGASAPLALRPSREVLLGSLGSNPAVTDPRSNTPRPTFEERLAMGLNPELCVKLERLPDGSLRRSMGRWRNGVTSAQATGLNNAGGAIGDAGAGPGGPGGPSGASVLIGGGGGGGVKSCS